MASDVLPTAAHPGSTLTIVSSTRSTLSDTEYEKVSK